MPLTDSKQNGGQKSIRIDHNHQIFNKLQLA